MNFSKLFVMVIFSLGLLAFVGTSPSIAEPKAGDYDANGFIANFELLDLIDDWEAGIRSLSDVINAINFWASGNYYLANENALILAPFYGESMVGYSDGLRDKLKDLGWEVDFYTDKDGTGQKLTIEQLDELIDNDYGIIHITSHTNLNQIAIEHFDNEDERDERYNELENQYGDDIAKNTARGKFVICVTSAFIETCSANWSSHPLIYLEGCRTGDHNSAFIPVFINQGAGAYVGFDGWAPFPWLPDIFPDPIDFVRTADEVSEDFYGFFIDSLETVSEAVQYTEPAHWIDIMKVIDRYTYLTSYNNTNGSGPTDENLVFY